LPYFEIPAGIPQEVIQGRAVTTPEKRYAGQQEVEIPTESQEQAQNRKLREATSKTSSGHTMSMSQAVEQLFPGKKYPDLTESERFQATNVSLGKDRYFGMQAPEGYSPMSGGSRYQQTLETGTTEKTIPEQVFKRSEAKKRQDAVGKSGQAVPERIFTGRKTRSESRWQFLTSSQEPTETVQTTGAGLWRTNDPLLAADAVRGLRSYIQGDDTPPNVTPFAALPGDVQEAHLQALDKLMDQIQAHMFYGRAPRRVKITPAVPGTVTKTHAVARYGAAVQAGTAGQQTARDEAEQAAKAVDDLTKKYSDKEILSRIHP
jgi:hypothetical protein